jgi:HPt (histidine-containing phosphotransfer) domain-containing protein
MLLSRVGGNRALALGLLREFYVSHADVVHRVRCAVQARANEDAFRLLHRTAGTAANLGLNQLAAAAGRAEEVMHHSPRGRRVAAGLDLDSVERCLHEALAEIQAAEIRLSDAPAGPPGIAISPGEVAALMHRLAEDLRASRLDALDVAATLAPHLGTAGTPLSAALARLDFVQAAGILGALQNPTETHGA